MKVDHPVPGNVPVHVLSCPMLAMFLSLISQAFQDATQQEIEDKLEKAQRSKLEMELKELNKVQLHGCLLGGGNGSVACSELLSKKNNLSRYSYIIRSGNSDLDYPNF